MQLCAILSQTQNHTEALDNAKKSVKLIHQLFKDLLSLCALYIRKIEKKENKLGNHSSSVGISQLELALNQILNEAEGGGDP